MKCHSCNIETEYECEICGAPLCVDCTEHNTNNDLYKCEIHADSYKEDVSIGIDPL